MGRLSKLHKTLTTKKPSEYYLKKPSVEECMSVLNKLVESMLKSKGNRRLMYKEQLETAHQNLATCMLHKKTLQKREEQLEARIEKQQKKIQKLDKSNFSYLAPKPVS